MVPPLFLLLVIFRYFLSDKEKRRVWRGYFQGILISTEVWPNC